MMRKRDVTFHGTNGAHYPAPVINVKVHGYVNEALLRQAAEDNGYGDVTGIFIAWWEANEPDSGELFNIACEHSWDDLQEDARYIYNDLHLKVYSTGRSGGWAYIDGFTAESVEAWDAIDLMRWERFCKAARAYADDMPYRMATLVLINGFDAALPALRREACIGGFELIGVGL